MLPGMRHSAIVRLRLLVVVLSVLAIPATVPGQEAARPDRFRIPPTDEGLPGNGPIRRYDWFQKVWMERRAMWARQRDQDRGAVVFLGDSITQGWGDAMGGAFPGMKVANRGIDGDTTRGVLIRLEDDVLSLKPRAVVLLIGTNDLEEGAAPDTIASNLGLILAALKQHDPRMPIVLCQVFPSSERMRRPADQIKAVNALYLARVKGDPQVIPLDTWRLFADADGNAPAAEFPDLLHPNEAGYARWAAALRPVFATLGLIEAEPDTFITEAGFELLFNGRDLTGWGYRATSEADKEAARKWRASDPNAAEWPIVTEAVSFDGRKATPDGRFRAINGRLVVTTPPEGRKIQQLWTTREFPDDFVLKLEFRATPNADSGVYLRGPQLQCRDYRLAGPYKDLQRYKPQDWNELVVTVQDGVARATVNGEPLEGELKVPATGPIGVEGDRGQMEYRRIRIARTTR
jgi:lysophospholipase L1-like esterase